ncbi:MAG: hypothetical protein QM747_13675 [Nocardioides sp.]
MLTAEFPTEARDADRPDEIFPMNSHENVFAPRRWLRLVAGWGVAVTCFAAGSVLRAGETKPASTDSPWFFSLLPKSLQSNPRIDVTVMTEMTAAGRKLAPVDAEHPAFFVIQSGGFRQTQEAAVSPGLVAEQAIDGLVRRSLASQGYFPEAPEQGRHASLVLIYTWGVHTRPAVTETLSGDDLVRNLYTRASLVGGDKFAHDLLKLIEQSSAQADAAQPTNRTFPDGERVVPSVLGPEMMSFMNPIDRYRDASARNEFLLEQVGNDLYFVVVSAYDYATLVAGKRTLLWRTRMTAAMAGVASTDALPTLIKSAGPYFGRETTDVTVLTPRSSATGKVEYGPLQVKEWDAKVVPADKK